MFLPLVQPHVHCHRLIFDWDATATIGPWATRQDGTMGKKGIGIDAADRGGYAGTACPILYDLFCASYTVPMPP